MEIRLSEERLRNLATGEDGKQGPPASSATRFSPLPRNRPMGSAARTESPKRIQLECVVFTRPSTEGHSAAAPEICVFLVKKVVKRGSS
jgi:hypothetical protein